LLLRSDNRVSTWIHEKADLGDTLYINGGQGEVFYTREMGDRLVLLAAGIGIAPIRGILNYADSIGDIKATLVYSASNTKELAFHQEFQNISKNNPFIDYNVTVSKSDTLSFREGRIDKRYLKSLNLGKSSLFYVSGPPEMIKNVIKDLKEMGVDEKKLKYELWW
jgi:nitric oxide dioxygenase